MKKSVLFIRLIFWLILVIIVSWLLYRGIVPNGKISYATDFKKPNFFIGNITPAERISAGEDGAVRIIGDPVYFSLRTPRSFDKAKLIIKYRGYKYPKGRFETSLVEAGHLVDKTIWRYDLKPVVNKLIDQLSLVWDVKKENGLMLLQRNNASSTVYASINDFLNNSPERNRVAVYNYDLQAPYLLSDYKSSNESESAIPSLRGPYQFYTYIKDEDLDFSFDFSDINQNKDSDPVDVLLYYGEQIIDTRHLDDDGIADDKGKESAVRRIDLKTAGLPEGVYKVEVRANDDIITNKMTTKQSKLAFINKIRLADGNADDINLFTDSNDISAETVNPARLQEIKIGRQTLDINQTYKMFDLTAEPGVKKIVLDKPDLILAGNGVFSFFESTLINPAIKKADSNLDLNGVNYILAGYQPPRDEDGWKIAEIEVDLSRAYRENGKYGFLISIPGLKINDGVDDAVEIAEIKAELEGITLLKRIKYIFIH